MTTITRSAPSEGVDPAGVLEELGLPLPAGWAAADAEVPSLWIGNTIHRESSYWFRERADEVQGTTVRNDAGLLVEWIDFLHLEREKTVHEVDQQDWRAFLRLRWLSSGGMSDSKFQRMRSVVKRFHRWLEGPPYFAPFRFRTVVTMSPQGYEGERLVGGPKVQPRSRPPVPIHPLLLQPYLDVAGKRGSAVYERNRAFLRFVVGTGLRRTAAALLTHYELPNRPRDPSVFPRVHSPTAISKSWGYDARCWPNLLNEVWIWNEHLRPDMAVLGREGGHHQPVSPLKIIEADIHTVKFVDPDGVVSTNSWDAVSRGQRNSLVDVDGTSPALWLTVNGTPMQPKTGYIVHVDAMARVLAQTADFPSRMRLHDLRHTYAMLGVVWWFLTSGFTVTGEDLADGEQQRIRAHNAVMMVKRDLGHVVISTTEHYVETALEWLSPTVTDDDAVPNAVTQEMIGGLS